MEQEFNKKSQREEELEVRVASAVPPVFFPYAVRGETVDLLSRAIERRATKFPGRQIPLFMASPGGLLSPAIFFWEFVRANKLRLHVTVLDRAHSSAIIILCAGERRVASSAARFLLHWPSLEIPPGRTTREDLARVEDLAKADDERFAEIVRDATGESRERIHELIQTKPNLTAIEARDLRLVHEVLDIGGSRGEK